MRAVSVYCGRQPTRTDVSLLAASCTQDFPAATTAERRRRSDGYALAGGRYASRAPKLHARLHAVAERRSIARLSANANAAQGDSGSRGPPRGTNARHRSEVLIAVRERVLPPARARFRARSPRGRASPALRRGIPFGGQSASSPPFPFKWTDDTRKTRGLRCSHPGRHRPRSSWPRSRCPRST